MSYYDMKTNLDIDDDLLEKAKQLTGINEEATLVRLGLKALVSRESSKKLAEMGGNKPQLKSIPRRRIKTI